MDRLRQIVRNRVLYRIPVYGERLERKHKEQAKVEARIRKFEREIKIEEDKHSKLNLTFGQIGKLQKIRSISSTQNWWCELEDKPPESKISGVNFLTEDPNWESNIPPERLEWIKLNAEAIKYCDDFWTVANQKFEDIEADIGSVDQIKWMDTKEQQEFVSRLYNKEDSKLTAEFEKQWYSYLGRLLVLEYKDERNNRPKDFLLFIIPNLIGCGYIFYKCIL